MEKRPYVDLRVVTLVVASSELVCRVEVRTSRHVLTKNFARPEERECFLKEYSSRSKASFTRCRQLA